MVFTLKNEKPSVGIPTLMDLTFDANDTLKQKYKLKTGYSHPGVVDGTVHNAYKNVARRLDKQYKRELDKHPEQVNLTEVEVSVSPKKEENQKRYFLTASNREEELALFKILSKTNKYYVAKFS